MTNFSSYQLCNFPAPYLEFRWICCTFIGIIAVFGNTAILIGVNRLRQPRTSYIILIASLAVTDIMFGLTMFLFTIEKSFPALSKHKYFCLTRLSLIMSLTANTGCTLALIATICFIGTWPFFQLKYTERIGKTLAFLLALVWIGTFAVGFIPVMGVNTFDNGVNVTCEHTNIINIDFNWLTALLVLCFLIYNGILYINMIYRLQKKHQDSRITPHVYRKTRLMALVWFVFAVCWMPYVMLSISSSEHYDVYCYIEYAIIPGYINSTLNWIIYGARNDEIMKSFRFNGIIHCHARSRIYSWSSVDRPNSSANLHTQQQSFTTSVL